MGIGGLVVLWRRMSPEEVPLSALFDAEDDEDKGDAPINTANADEEDKENDEESKRHRWTTQSILRLPEDEDVLDVAWSPCGRFLLAGTSSNEAVLFDTLSTMPLILFAIGDCRWSSAAQLSRSSALRAGSRVGPLRCLHRHNLGRSHGQDVEHQTVFLEFSIICGIFANDQGKQKGPHRLCPKR